MWQARISNQQLDKAEHARGCFSPTECAVATNFCTPTHRAKFSKAATEAKHKVKSGLLLDVVVRKSTPVFKLLASKDQALLIRRDTLFILNLRFNIVDGIAGFHIKGNGFASQCLHENLHTSAKAKHKMER